GSGKTVAIAEFARRFGYGVETVYLYKDMTARDLVQRRGTRSGGSTFWENSGLVTAALEGKIAVLDGLQWVGPGTIATLQRLVQDREISLPDGTFLTNAQNYARLMHENKWTEKDLASRSIYPIHPSFRIIATATVTPHHSHATTTQSQESAWLTEEVATMFSFVKVDGMSGDEEGRIIQAVTGCPPAAVKRLLEFAQKFRALAEGGGHESVLAKSASLSTRQLIRIARRIAAYPTEDLYAAIQRTCLSAFLPGLAKQALEDVLADAGIRPQKITHQ
ncbi:von Willebrand factor A domain-containing protein 8, partial [Borealophlyctis nickersoniae]